ncbi:Fic family protein [Microbacterium sp. ZXX196]|uniref:Fic family protein n=1 Tax=Microbacterium sp. ZXX196 TaxID=2609291 RepID=UPI0012B7A827|nr:Fic family protein [Microbacterium sp. ZXX196]MTE23989.1 Fic family protein [Microbacterium sp. ZXX196]
MAPPSDAFAVSWETVPWERDATLPASRRQRLAARGPYAAAIPARIRDTASDIAPDLAAEAEDAIREIARFDAELTARAGGAGDEIAPLASVLLRTESASSSQIEGVTAGARALALAGISQPTGRNAELVAQNVAAMTRAIALSDEMAEGAILQAHAALMAGERHASPGQFRTEQVWIGGGPSPHTAEFVPPRAERIPGAMADLMAFTRRADIPLLTHAAIAHAQFETIHPFADGNGRVGRALVHAMLRRAGATTRMTVPVSAGLLADTRGYTAALMDFRRGDVEPIVRAFVNAAFRGAANGRVLAEELARIRAGWEERLPSRRGSAARRLLDVLVRQPALTTPLVVGELGVASSAAQRAIAQLTNAGIIEPRSANARRNRVWLAPEVLDALDAFAARAGRRDPLAPR